MNCTKCGKASFSPEWPQMFKCGSLVNGEAFVQSLKCRIAELEQLVAALVDHDPCDYDHNDNCLTHNVQSRPCPHERAKALLEKL